MEAFMCCFWWFVFGVLVGWLLSWLLAKLFGKNDSGSAGGGHTAPPPTYSPPAPVAAPIPAPPPPVQAPVMPPAAVAPIAPPVAYVPVAAPTTVSPEAARMALIAAAASAGIVIKGPDDLKIVEGIGPKIEALLQESGIRTWAQLGTSSVQTLSAVLDKAGPRFKLANPESWSEQARLAHGGQWLALKNLQDELVGGVHMQDDEDEGDPKPGHA
jgi:predicted flap endonuclease-1-like 5' DNA nuclease